MKKPEPLYQIEFIDNYGHFYKIEGETERLNSVTSINKYAGDPSKTEALMGWANKLFANHAESVLTEYIKGVKEELEKVRIEEIIVDTKFIKRIADGLDIDKLMKDGKAQRKIFLNNAGDIGTRLHAAVDEFFKTNKIPALDNDTNQAFQNFMKWWNTNNYKVILADTIVASRKYRFGGRFDALFEDKDGNIVIADFKTSSSIQSIEYKLQLSAYMEALKETYGITNVKYGLLIRFDKEKIAFETLVVNNLDDYFKGFLGALKIKELSEKTK